MDAGINKGLYFSWIVAMVATLGSLYFSEIAHFMPCELCWFQRICMYPLTIILGIACFRNDNKVALYVLPMTIIGCIFSAIHILEQKLDIFTRICTEGVPCSGEYIHWFGFMTIPMLALVAFLLISITMVISLVHKKG